MCAILFSATYIYFPNEKYQKFSGDSVPLNTPGDIISSECTLLALWGVICTW